MVQKKNAMFRDLPILWPWELPERLSGVVVVIDVYAATSNIAFFLARQVAQLLLVNNESVHRVKHQHKGALVIGEDFSLPDDFFDTGNQPHKTEGIDISGKEIIYMSNNGTRIIDLAFRKGARNVIATSFLNMGASVSWLREISEHDVLLLPAGDVRIKENPVTEDMACAETLRDILMGKPVDWKERFREVEEFMLSYYDPEHCKLDIPIITDLNRYPVVPLCHWKRDGLISVSAARQ